MSTDHRKLTAYRLADELAVKTYRATRSFPASERFGLCAQIRRAAVSVPANIVEGCARDSDREHSRYLEIAFGSTREWLYLVDLSKRLQLIDPASADELLQFGGRVAATIAALRKSLNRYERP